MRLLAPIIRLARHASEWYGSVRQRVRQRRAEDKAVVVPYDHGILTDESFAYWVNRILREENNGTRRRNDEQ